MRFYRGISGTEEKVAGLIHDALQYGAIGECVRKDHAVPSQFRDGMDGCPVTAATVGDVFAACEFRRMTYACGNVADAANYAGRRKAPAEVAAVIAFEADEADVTCDPLDALHGFFGIVRLIPRGVASAACRAVAEKLDVVYGPALCRYLDAARERSATEAQELCEAACRDLDVIRHHYANERFIKGKPAVGFWFSSVFRVPTLVDPATVSTVDFRVSEDPSTVPSVDFPLLHEAVRREAASYG